MDGALAYARIPEDVPAVKSDVQLETLSPPGIKSERSMEVARHPLWANPRVLAGVCLLLITYGSLLPFDLHLPSGAEGWRLALASPQWVEADGPTSSLGLSASVSDLLINLLLYVPLGVLLRFSIPGKLRLGVIGAAIATLGVFAVSWGLESLQSLTPSRVASLNDVIANVATGGLAACLCLWLWARFRAMAFQLYCWTVPLRHLARRAFDAMQTRAWLAYAFVGLNGLLIGGWYLLQLGQYQHETDDEALPFVSAFELPYDTAAVVLGRTMLVYVGLGTLVLLAMVSRRERVRLGWIVVVVVGLSVAAEAHRAATHNARPDITGPILAATAATLMALTLYCFSLAVRKANRRHQPHPYNGPERRRIDYDYL